MSIALFMLSLYETGRARISADLEGPSAESVLERIDGIRRLEMAYRPPELVMPVALWAAQLLYDACYALLNRDVSADTVKQMLGKPCPLPVSAGVVYSVDLVLGYLPDVLSLAKGLSEDDPLVVELLRIAQQWPLSSVGLKQIAEVDAATIASDRSLLQLYVDRIIERGDTSRLSDPKVRQAVRAALGNFPTLAPALAAELEKDVT